MLARERPEDLDDLHASLPDALEYWADPRETADASARPGMRPDEPTGPNPFRYLTALRQSPPGIKSFG